MNGRVVKVCIVTKEMAVLAFQYSLLHKTFE